MALGLGKHTYKTIKENLFWAFPTILLPFLLPRLACLHRSLARWLWLSAM